MTTHQRTLSKRANTFCKRNTEWALDYSIIGTDKSFTVHTWDGKKPSYDEVQKIIKIVDRAIGYVYYYNTVVPNEHNTKYPTFADLKVVE